MRVIRLFLFSVCLVWTMCAAYADKLDDELCRLKVADAERCGWDTLPAFRHRCKVEQGKALRSVMLDTGKTDSLLHALYRESVERYSAKGWVRLEEISFLLPQSATRKEVDRACRQMDSVYASLRNGTPFDMYLKEGSVAQWRPSVALLKEFSSRLETMQKGSYSEPFLSPLGVHIIRLVDWKPAISYEEACPYLQLYLEHLGAGNPALDRIHYAQWQKGGGGDTVIVRCMQEVKNRLLIAWWDARYPLPASDDEKELERFFKANKEDYAWEFPHYKGAVVLCREKKVASRLRKRLKKVPMEEMEAAFRAWMEEHPEANVQIQAGLFQIGKNPYVDKLAFRCGELPHDARYPYAVIVGKKLKKGPESYTDVREEVEKDFRLLMKMKQLEELKERLSVR